jgi:hypothetical protein
VFRPKDTLDYQTQKQLWQSSAFTTCNFKGQIPKSLAG